jgi:hypothetical protein
MTVYDVIETLPDGERVVVARELMSYTATLVVAVARWSGRTVEPVAYPLGSPAPAVALADAHHGDLLAA